MLNILLKSSLKTFLVIFGLLVLTSCSGSDERHVEHMQQSGDDDLGMDHSRHDELAAVVGEPSEISIYNASSRWRDQSGRELELNELRGKNRVIAMVYTHCEYACPRIVADMRRIRDELDDETLSETGFVIVSIDPERDTPERLHTFARENHLSEDQWTLLHGETGDVMELAALLGVKYKRTSDTDFSHSNLITILNEEGEIIHRHRSLESSVQPAVKALSGGE